MYISSLNKFSRVGCYSLGSACLTTLYRELCCATSPSMKVMGGCEILLQLWAWYHMPLITPMVNHELSYRVGKIVLVQYANPNNSLIRWLGNSLPPHAFRNSTTWSACIVLTYYSIIK
ncbi:Protein MAIN-LIKE 2, partial [Mucuna pruriens]